MAQSPAGAPAAAAAPPGYRDQYAGKKRVLVIGDTRTGNQAAHDAVSHAISTLEQLGRRNGDYIAFVRSETDLITKAEVWGKGDYAKGGSKQAPGRNLNYFDAVVFYTNGETELSDAQKRDLLSFVHDDGKGFIGVHTATATAYQWPEYGAMIGAYFDDHPWNVFDAPVQNERPDSPIVKHLPKSFVMRDEMYQYKAPYLRGNVDVLLSMDPSKLDLGNPRVHRTDRDFPLAWTKTYGKGRVFSSSLGHSDLSWDDPRVQTMYLEAIRWVLHLSDAEVKPHAALPPSGPDYVPANVPRGSGHYPAIMESDKSLPTHTIYRPARLDTLRGRKLPVIVWANGACVNIGNRFRYFLSEIASHGYLAIAIGPPGSAAMESMSELAPAIGQPVDISRRVAATQSTQLIDAINWAVAENARPDSQYYGRLDTAHVAMAGQSCGGLQAIAESGDPRVATTLVLNSGVIPGTNLPGAAATHDSLKALHAPTLYLSGDSSDVAYKNANSDFELINGVPLFRAWKAGVGHAAHYREIDGGVFAPVVVAWLDWQFRHDRTAARMFSGANCTLCKDANWTVQKKLID
jgi:uncharacterized protein